MVASKVLTLTCVYVVPVGSAATLSWPNALLPQHWIEPSSRTAQVCTMPDDSCVNRRPAGAAGIPLTCPDSSTPQQASAPSARTAQAWSPPTATWLYVPAGTPAVDGYPQHTTVPSVRTAQEDQSPAETCV